MKRLCVVHVLLALFIVPVNAGELPICSNIKNYLAFESATSWRLACARAGVKFSQIKMENWFRAKLTKNEASPNECRAKCALLNATNGTEMANCVQNSLVRPFIEGMGKEIVFNRSNCEKIASEL